MMGGLDRVSRAKLTRSRSAKDKRGGSADLKAEVIKALKDADLAIIEATRPDKWAPGFDFTIDKDISYFSTCARDLGIKAILLEAQELEEEDFFYEGDSPEEFRSEDGRIDLRGVKTKLREFEQYLGSCRLVVLTGCFGSTSISYWDSMDWFVEFQDLRDEAIEQLIAESDETEERLEREHQERNNEIMLAIRDLVKGDTFKDTFSRTRPTQAAILAFIRTSVEGAESLPASLLRGEANKLRDRIVLNR